MIINNTLAPNTTNFYGKIKSSSAVNKFAANFDSIVFNTAIETESGVEKSLKDNAYWENLRNIFEKFFSALK